MQNDLQIKKETAGDVLTAQIIGDLNVKTSPHLEEELTKSIGGMKKLILDFTDVEYISSAGLRVLLAMEKNMRRQGGSMTLSHVNPAVREIIRLAGFLQVMHIED